MLKNLCKSLLGTTLAVMLVACGGGGSISSDGAQKALVSTQLAQVNLQTQLAAAQSGSSSSIKVTTNGTSSSYSGALTNPGGGSATVSGSVTVSSGETIADITVIFANWHDPVQNLTLNGALKLHQDVSSSGINLTESGEVEVSGAVSGTASFNLTVTQTGSCSSTTGNISGNVISVKVGC